mmetsp:Transcript_6751/g.15599  ORF Transcript_6751/g.15599 Transcript_6751/m.15599 type:complete len:472 (+) Transcript_6751:76-1491(+)
MLARLLDLLGLAALLGGGLVLLLVRLLLLSLATITEGRDEEGNAQEQQAASCAHPHIAGLAEHILAAQELSDEVHGGRVLLLDRACATGCGILASAGGAVVGLAGLGLDGRVDGERAALGRLVLDVVQHGLEGAATLVASRDSGSLGEPQQGGEALDSVVGGQVVGSGVDLADDNGVLILEGSAERLVIGGHGLAVATPRCVRLEEDILGAVNDLVKVVANDDLGAGGRVLGHCLALEERLHLAGVAVSSELGDGSRVPFTSEPELAVLLVVKHDGGRKVSGLHTEVLHRLRELGAIDPADEEDALHLVRLELGLHTRNDGVLGALDNDDELLALGLRESLNHFGLLTRDLAEGGQRLIVHELRDGGHDVVIVVHTDLLVEHLADSDLATGLGSELGLVADIPLGKGAASISGPKVLSGLLGVGKHAESHDLVVLGSCLDLFQGGDFRERRADLGEGVGDNSVLLTGSIVI